MNKIYKLKYDRRRNQVVAVSELTTGAGKESTGQVDALTALAGAGDFRKFTGALTPLAFLTGLVMALLPGIALANPDLPTGGQIVQGQGSISTGGNQMTVTQNTHGMVTNWNSFDIGKNHTVQFVQPDSSAIALNRVTGGHESQILGTLTANGQVMLVNPAGVMFGKGATVNTAGLVASTKNISNVDFMAGRYTLSGSSHPGAEVVNQGSLTTTEGGYIVLAADRVKNSGTLRTPGGKTVLAAGDSVTLQLDNSGLSSVSVSGSVVNALVENSGLLSATNGQVYLTARGKDMLLNTVVNNRGTVEAKGLKSHGGEIVLDGGDSGVVRQSGMLLADSAVGHGGKITVEGKNIHLEAKSRTSATGKTGGGEVYVGGGWQGKDGRVRNASKVVMDGAATVDVSATERGNGGTAVLWSEDYTNFRGTVLAKGGVHSGNGGQVETSSHDNLQAFGKVDASAPAGKGGNWLLDPTNVTIVGDKDDSEISKDSSEGMVFTPTADGAKIKNSTIVTALDSGQNVTIKTSGHDTADQKGDITVNADISYTGASDVSLTLQADGDISISNHKIESTNGKLDVNLYAAGSGSGNIALDKATVNTNGGNITLGKKNDSGEHGALTVNITNSSNLDAAGGDITINAWDFGVNKTQKEKIIAVTNSTLKGRDISLTGTQKGDDVLSSPVYLKKATITASGDISLKGENGKDRKQRILNLDADDAGADKGNNLTASGNINITNAGGKLIITKGALTAGKNLNLEASTSGDDSNPSLLVKKANLKADSGTLTITGKGIVKYSGVALRGSTITAKDINITGTGAKDTEAKGLIIANTVLTATGSMSLIGKTIWGVGLFSEGLKTAIHSGGTLLLSGTSGGYAKALSLSGIKEISGDGDVTITGISTGGADRTYVPGGAVIVNNTQNNMTISSKKDLKITGASEGGAGLSVVSGKDTVSLSSGGAMTLNGSSSVNNGLMITGSLVTSTGKLVIQGDGKGKDYNGLALNGTTISAASASLTGTNTDGGYGFNLSGVTLAGDVKGGANLTLSSEGSDAGTTNVLDAGISYNNFKALKQTGMDNNTLMTLTGNAEVLKEMGYEASKDWTFDSSDSHVDVPGKAGRWDLVLSDAVVDFAHNITLTGVGLKNSTLKGNELTLKGNGSTELTVENSELTAKEGDVLLEGERVRLEGGGTHKTVTSSKGKIDIQAKGNAPKNTAALTVNNIDFSSTKGTTLSGEATENNTGVRLSGNITATTGGLTVKGTGTRVTSHQEDYPTSQIDSNDTVWGINARNANISVTSGTLTMTGQVTGAPNALFSNSVVGLDLGGDTTSLSADKAILTGSSLSEGWGFRLNSALYKGIEGGKNLTLSSVGSNSLVRNFVGDKTSDAAVKYMIENSPTSVGNLTQVGKVNIYSQSDLDGMVSSGNLEKDYGLWSLIFDGITLNESGNIDIKGASFTNSNLKANSLAIDNGVGTLDLTGSSLEATSGDITLKAERVKFANGNVNKEQRKQISATGDFSLSARNANLSSVSVKADNINFDVKGDGTDYSLLTIGNSDLTATNKINADLTSGLSVFNPLGGLAPFEGVVLNGKDDFVAKNITITATAGPGRGSAIYLGDKANIHFTGDTKINATKTGDNPGGTYWEKSVAFASAWGRSDITVNNGSLVIDAHTVSDVALGSFMNSGQSGNSGIRFHLNNADVNLSATSDNGSGIQYWDGGSGAGNFSSGLTFEGQGNVSVSGTGKQAGIAGSVLDNINLDGKFSVHGHGEEGAGVRFAWNSVVKLKDADIKGESDSGAGIVINANKGGNGASDKKVDLNGNTLEGNSVSGFAGVAILGQNVTLANGKVTGKVESGEGAGVSLTGGKNYSISSATVTGTSADGAGVAASGNLVVNSGTVLKGTSAGTGNGVEIKGNLQNTEGEKTQVIGTATSGGDGVHISGNTSIANTDIQGSSGSGNGVNMKGNLNIGTGKINGTTGTGNGVNVSGTVNLDKDVTVRGESTGSGNGMSLSGKIEGTSPESNTIEAVSASGNGLLIKNKADIHKISVSARSEGDGDGIVTTDDINITDTVLDGSSAGKGNGVNIGGAVSGGKLSGFSQNGTGVKAGTGSSLKDVEVMAKTVDGVAADVSGLKGSDGDTNIKVEVSGHGSSVKTESDTAGRPDIIFPPFADTTLPPAPDRVPSAGQEETAPAVVEARQHAYTTQSVLSHSERMKHPAVLSGYREQDKAVSVEICTDGQCRKLDAGMSDSPGGR
ncbi:filamentous hemagglutinin N-terminal domain-containing protein [Salmonella enterica subsp. enterica serovar Newport]